MRVSSPRRVKKDCCVSRREYFLRQHLRLYPARSVLTATSRTSKDLEPRASSFNLPNVSARLARRQHAQTMSRRRRAAEPAPEEEQDEERDPEGLKFNEPLSWRPGKAIPTTELVKRLNKLSKELAELDQEWEHKESLNNVAQELSSSNIIGHKDKGVKAFAACCLVDILKICAPDAPFAPSQLKVRLTCPVPRRYCDTMLTLAPRRTSSPCSSHTLSRPFQTRPPHGTTSINTS